MATYTTELKVYFKDGTEEIAEQKHNPFNKDAMSILKFSRKEKEIESVKVVVVPEDDR